ncbi:MAG: hypothetical protein LBH69_04900 [Methanomassiliicoccaceae archaeon]|nr:hypothetical protein [Methanomassiliicoccaceae archaeon]
MYMSKETFEKWRRGEVKIKGERYPVCDLTDDDFVIAKKKPDTVFGPQTNKYPKKEWLRKRLDAIDNPAVKADLLYVMRKYMIGKEFKDIDFEKWDGSYVFMLLIFMRHCGGYVSRKYADKRYVDPKDWEEECEEGEDYDEGSVDQDAYMDVIDNGKKIRIHIWGRDDG